MKRYKNGVLVCAPSGIRKNIGDYIQSVAQAQFLDCIDVYVDREQIDSIESDSTIKVIMNGWFMFHPEHFPPSSCIEPLFVSFHLTPRIHTRFFSDVTIRYLKKHEPIGARDLETMEALERHGVKSYFSGCLTTTLGFKYSAASGDQVLFVDPFYSLAGTRRTLYDIKGYFLDLLYLVKHYKKVNCFIDKWDYEFRTWYGKIFRRLEKRMSASVFYEKYRHCCTDDLIFNAKYITHNIPSNRYSKNEEWMKCAEDLIRTYAESKFIITSRIHCALPCLGVDTPVIFIVSNALKGNSLRSSGRFKGLIELINTLDYDNDFSPLNDIMKNTFKERKLSRSTQFKNPDGFMQKRDSLIETVRRFLH